MTISTDLSSDVSELVDKLPRLSSVPIWIGVMLPKRHARRAVTRNQLKRQIRAAFGRHEAMLPEGRWLVRLRVPFTPTQFVSARSALLGWAVRAELDGLMRPRRTPAQPLAPSQAASGREP